MILNSTKQKKTKTDEIIIDFISEIIVYFYFKFKNKQKPLIKNEKKEK